MERIGKVIMASPYTNHPSRAIGQLEAIRESYGSGNGSIHANPTDWKKGIVIHRQLANPYDSDISTAQTVERMKQLAKDYRYNPIVQLALREIFPFYPQLIQATQIEGYYIPLTSREIAKSIWHWVKGRVMFVEDELILVNGLGERRIDKELLLTPDALLTMPIPMGDCDDFSLLGATLLLSMGVPTSYITIAADPQEPERFSHIYLKVYLTDELIQGNSEVGSMALDISHGLYPGWESPQAFRKVEWFIS